MPVIKARTVLFDYGNTLEMDPFDEIINKFYDRAGFASGILSVLDNWKKKIVIEDFQIPLLQIIFSKCCVKALLLEEFVNLPTHIQTVPKISKDKENKFKDKEKNSKE